MNYLLDTNAVVALLRNKPLTVRERFRAAELAGDYLAVSSVVLYELWYGVEKSTHIPENTERLRIFLSGDIDVLALDDEDAKSAGRVCAALEKSGTTIGPYDLLIAGQALARGLTVVTANASEFARVQGLGWVDWTRQPLRGRGSPRTAGGLSSWAGSLGRRSARMRAIVAGAGIGGLTTALSLHAAGIDALVIDAAASLRPLGVGINLLPHAVRELTELGLGDELAATGIPTAEWVHFDRHGNRIWGFASGQRLGYHWPQYSIHRGELQMMLLAAVRARLGADSVRAGTAFISFSDSPSRVEVQVRDRASGAVSALRADVLVGADGLYSGVRAQLHPDEPPPRWGGIMMWRGLVEGEPFLTGRTVAVSGANADLKFVTYPISRRAEAQGKALLNWVAEVRRPGEAAVAELADWNRRGRASDVLPWFEDWRFGWLDVPALIAGTPQILEYPMVDRDPLPFWGQGVPWGHGRVTLLGDAAHPMYPIGANGGSQAIIDARVLAYSLARAATPADGLAAYEMARRETVNAIVLACRDMPADRMLHQVSMRAPDGFDRIEDVLSPAELTAFDKAYRATTLQDVAALNARASLNP